MVKNNWWTFNTRLLEKGGWELGEKTPIYKMWWMEKEALVHVVTSSWTITKLCQVLSKGTDPSGIYGKCLGLSIN